MLCCGHLESRNHFLTFSFCYRHFKVYKQCYLPHSPCRSRSTFFCGPIIPTSFPPPDHLVRCCFLLKYPSTSAHTADSVSSFNLNSNVNFWGPPWFIWSLSSNLLSHYPFISLKTLTTICNLICFLAPCHTSPPPKCKVAGESAILSILMAHWWIVSLTHGKHPIFIWWVNKYVNHINKWCSTNFLGGIFFFC